MTKQRIPEASRRLAELRKKVVSKRQRKAAGWEEEAVKELAEEEGDDPEDYEWKKGTFAHSIMVEYGRMEWHVFEDYDDAERAAKEYLSDMVEHEPEIVGKDLIQQHVTMDDTTRRTIAIEEADSYIGDIQDDRELDRLEDWTDVSDYEELVERIDEVDSELIDLDDDEIDLDVEDDSYDADLVKIEKARAALEDEQKELPGKKDQMFEDLKEEAAEAYGDEIEKRIKDDLMGWLDDLGYDLSDSIPSFLSIDWDGIVEALMQDGIEYWFASYDHVQVELDSGAVAYRWN